MTDPGAHTGLDISLAYHGMPKAGKLDLVPRQRCIPAGGLRPWAQTLCTSLAARGPLER